MRNALKAQVIMHGCSDDGGGDYDYDDNDDLLLFLSISFHVPKCIDNNTQVVIVPGDIVYQVCFQHI